MSDAIAPANPVPELYRQTWDEESVEVFRRMDAYDASVSLNDETKERLIRLGLEIVNQLEEIADKVLNARLEERDKHIEVLLMLLAFTPSENSLYYIKRISQDRPDIYGVLFATVMQRRELRDTGKIIRERIAFFIKRSAVIDDIYNPDVSLALLSALESFKRRPKA